MESLNTRLRKLFFFAAMYKVSIVSYTNALPFLFGIKNQMNGGDIDLYLDIPSVCAQKVIDAEVDAGLIPVAELLKLDNYQIFSRFCIGANGPVFSVKLYSEVPIHEIENVLLDYQSRTSVNLTKVLMKSHWKHHPNYLNAEKDFISAIKDKTAAVVIGDRTFGLNGKYKYEYDLSEEWKKFTGLPFVFAVWVSKQTLDKSWVERFDAALEYGLEHRKLAVESKKHEFENVDLVKYVNESIDYSFDEEKKKALKLFLEMLRNL